MLNKSIGSLIMRMSGFNVELKPEMLSELCVNGEVSVAEDQSCFGCRLDTSNQLLADCPPSLVVFFPA
jgi:hypothetical protein